MKAYPYRAPGERFQVGVISPVYRYLNTILLNREALLVGVTSHGCALGVQHCHAQSSKVRFGVHGQAATTGPERLRRHLAFIIAGRKLGKSVHAQGRQADSAW